MCQGCTGLYVGLIRWLRLLPFLGLYRGLYSWLCYFCSFGPVLLVVWHACVLGRQEDNKRTRRREIPGEGQKEERRRQGGQEKTGRRPGRGPPPPKSQSSSMWLSKAPESRRSRPEREAPSAVRAVQRGAPEPPVWRPPNKQAFAFNFGLGLYFKTMGLYAGVVPHKP